MALSAQELNGRLLKVEGWPADDEMLVTLGYRSKVQLHYIGWSTPGHSNVWHTILAKYTTRTWAAQSLINEDKQQQGQTDQKGR